MKSVILGTLLALMTTPLHASSETTVVKEKFSTADGKNARKYDLDNLRGDPFSPGQDEETLLSNLRKLHEHRPQEIGNKSGEVELILSDRNDADYIARINYTNGRLDLYLQRGGMMRSVLVPFIDKTPTGKKKKYIMLWAEWTIGKSVEGQKFDF